MVIIGLYCLGLFFFELTTELSEHPTPEMPLVSETLAGWKHLTLSTCFRFKGVKYGSAEGRR